MATQSKPAVGSKNIFHNIIFGGTAGVVGQTSVFPMYTIKTRLHLYPGRYHNILHCARKIIQHDGLRGLYRGLPPALTGVFPEKAIKLSVNDYLTATLASPSGQISVPMSMVAGAGAGLCQVIATNPMELLMINMQSNAARGNNIGLVKLIRQLGLPGLYKGTAATLFRDIPFSMIFFSMNASLRKALSPDGDQSKLPMRGVFTAGLASGATAAYLSTPMDVVKTRLQANAGTASEKATKITPAPALNLQNRQMSTVSKASVQYKGIADCARHIFKEEGIRGFFAGGIPRIMIISPLFGITLFFYDIQRRLTESGKL